MQANWLGFGSGYSTYTKTTNNPEMALPARGRRQFLFWRSIGAGLSQINLGYSSSSLPVGSQYSPAQRVYLGNSVSSTVTIGLHYEQVGPLLDLPVYVVGTNGAQIEFWEGWGGQPPTPKWDRNIDRCNVNANGYSISTTVGTRQLRMFPARQTRFAVAFTIPPLSNTEFIRLNSASGQPIIACEPITREVILSSRDFGPLLQQELWLTSINLQTVWPAFVELYTTG